MRARVYQVQIRIRKRHNNIMWFVRTSSAILRQMWSVSRSLTQDTTRHLRQSVMILNGIIDLCNVVFDRLAKARIIRLQAFINATACLALRVKKMRSQCSRDGGLASVAENRVSHQT